MNHPFGPNGPYFKRPCQRDRFPSLVDEVGERGDKLVSGLGNVADMGSRLKRGRLNTRAAEKRAAELAKEANVPPARLFLRSTSRGLRRAIDIYMPRFEPEKSEPSSDGDRETPQPSEDQDEEQQEQQQAVRPGSEPAARQRGEAPYTGSCRHCHRQGSNDGESDDRGRFMAHRISQNMDLFNEHLVRHIVQRANEID